MLYSRVKIYSAQQCACVYLKSYKTQETLRFILARSKNLPNQEKSEESQHKFSVFILQFDSVGSGLFCCCFFRSPLSDADCAPDNYQILNSFKDMGQNCPEDEWRFHLHLQNKRDLPEVAVVRHAAGSLKWDCRYQTCLLSVF